MKTPFTLNYSIIYPSHIKSNISATIRLNGKLLFWATLQSNDRLRDYSGKPINKSKIWQEAKRLTKTPIFRITHTLAFLALNKAFAVDYLMKSKTNRSIYYCFSLKNNDFHNFIIASGLSIHSSLAEKNYIYPVSDANNYNYIADFDFETRTLKLIDPPATDKEKHINRAEIAAKYNNGLRCLLKTLGVEKYQYANQTYIIARDGKDFFGMDKRLFDNPLNNNEITNETEIEEIYIKNGIIVGGFDDEE